ncbi:MAG: glycosyltransferase [Desulfovibrionaceae bacterium]|nr:glycosyltransferase [Desulfovibrionaceae bacterium]
MRILLLGGMMLKGALIALGHSVLSFAFTKDADIVLGRTVFAEKLLAIAREHGFEPDAFFYCDNGNLPMLIDPETLDIPSVWYSIDTYCNAWHVPYAKGFDRTLVAQKDFVSQFTNEGIRADWFPLFANENTLHEPGGERDVPVAFVGTLGHKNNPDRKPFLEAFKTLHPLVHYQGNYIPLFTRSRIVLNQTAALEVNFRCFESIACGAALLMETCENGLGDLFAIGQEILPTYTRNNAQEAAARAREALAHTDSLQRITEAGFQAVKKRHTDRVRAKTLTGILESIPHGSREDCRKERGASVRKAFSHIATHLPETMDKERAFFKKVSLRTG